jgi:Predicted membrane protein
MSTSSLLVVVGAFLASAVEMVEALTIVLGVGIVRGWRSPLIGAGCAAVVLAALVAALGPALQVIPIGSLRLVVGALLLAFGLQWLRKAILRTSGYKALHDEDEAFREGREQAAGAAPEEKAGLDWYAFTVSFKGVFLEGLEVVFIVIAFGAGRGLLVPASLGALAACVVVLAIGAIAHRPLARVPENTLKFAVGVILCAFGVFWTGEGLGIAWPGGDLMILAFGAAFLLVGLGAAAIVRQPRGAIAQ